MSTPFTRRLTRTILLASLLLPATGFGAKAPRPALGRFHLTERGHCWLLPRHEEKPVLDGMADDPLWRKEDTAAGVLITPEGRLTHSVRLSSDEQHLYLMISGVATGNPNDRIIIQLQAQGARPASFELSGDTPPRYLESPPGESDPLKWPASSEDRLPGIIAMRTVLQKVETREVAIPLVPLGLGRKTGERITLRICSHDSASGRLSRLDLDSGMGILIGRRAAIVKVTLDGKANGPGQGELEILYSGPDLTGAVLRFTPVLMAGPELPSTLWNIPILRSGLSLHPLVFHRLPSGPLHHFTLTLTVPGGEESSTRLDSSHWFQPFRTYLQADLLEALPPEVVPPRDRTDASKTEENLPLLLRTWLTQMKWSIAEKQPVPEPDPVDSADLLPLLPGGGIMSKEEASVFFSLLQSWNAEPNDPDYAPPPLAIALRRTEYCLRLADMILKNHSTGTAAEAETLLPLLLTQALSHQRTAGLLLMDPWQQFALPDSALFRFARNARDLHFFPESTHWLKDIVTLAADRILLMTYPDGCPVDNDTEAASALATLMRCTGEAKDAGLKTEDLRSILLPRAYLRYHKIWEMKESFTNDSLSTGLALFLPEGASMANEFPLHSPDPALPVFGGRYAMACAWKKFSLTARIDLSSISGERGSIQDRRPLGLGALGLSVFGREFLRHDYPREEAREAQGDSSPLTTKNGGPPSSPPFPRGSPLPWLWRSSPPCDLLSAEWPLPGAIIAGRTVILCKDTWEEQPPVVILIDRLAAAERRNRTAIRNFLVAPGITPLPASGGVSLATNDGQYLHLILPEGEPSEFLPLKNATSSPRILACQSLFTEELLLLTVLLPSTRSSAPLLELQKTGSRAWRLPLEGRESLIIVIPKDEDRTTEDQRNDHEGVTSNAETAILHQNGEAVKSLLFLNGTRLKTDSNPCLRAELSTAGSFVLWADQRGEMTALLLDCEESVARLVITLGRGEEERQASISLERNERVRFRPF